MSSGPLPVPSDHISAWARCNGLPPSEVRRHWNRYQDTMWTYTPVASVEKAVVYGTLRPGDYNAHRTELVKEAAKNNPRDGDPPFKRVIIPGARIHNLGGSAPVFPVLTLTGDPADTVVGDMFTMDWGSPTGNHVLRMEFGARYVLSYVPVLEQVEGDLVEHSEVAVFVYTHEIQPHQHFIESGDWFEFALQDRRP